MTPKEIIEKNFAGTSFLVRGKTYPKELPSDLSPWYCYTSDGGHSILALLEGHFEEEEDLFQCLCPIPVKTVMRGYRIHKGFVVATKGFEYNSRIGLVTDPDDDEF